MNPILFLPDSGLVLPFKNSFHLLTSARHMPRALAVFRAAGWHVAPYPVDYRSVGFSRWSDYSLARGAVRWQLVLHEAMGLAAFAGMGLADF